MYKRQQFRQSRNSGVTGVIANVVSLLTGAAQDGGFKGLGGRFDRRDLLSFDADVPLEIRFTRLDTGAAVDVAARMQGVPADPEMGALMQEYMHADANPEAMRRFGTLWQDRVRRILLEHGDTSEVFILQTAA